MTGEDRHRLDGEFSVNLLNERSDPQDAANKLKRGKVLSVCPKNQMNIWIIYMNQI